jgi:DNA polymerase-3 subunit delta
MIVKGNRIEPFLKAPDAGCRAVLVYGPDQGLVRERIDRLAKTVVADLRDPFRVAELPQSRLVSDPALLADEAQAIAMTGGRRVVIIRDAADSSTPSATSFLANPAGDALVLFEGGDLGKSSSLRKLFEAKENAAILACYADEGESLTALIVTMLKENGLTAEPEALDFLSANLGGDRRLSRMELSKLILYMGCPGKISLDDAIACVGDSAQLSMDDLALAVADGNHADAQHTLDRLLADGESPITVIRSVVRHFTRLHVVKSHISQGASTEQALGQLRPPVFFKAADRFKRQLSRWQLDRLSMALEVLLDAEIDCKTTGLPAKEITARALMRLTQAAGRSAKG